MRSTIGHVLAALCILPAGASFAADSAYAVSNTDVTAATGHKATASVTITAKNGWHLNQEAPFTLKLTPAPGVVVDKPKLGRGDLALSTQTQARFDVGMTLSDPGKKVIEAEASFVLCQEDSCRPIKEKLTITAEATAAPAAPAKKTGKKRARRS